MKKRLLFLFDLAKVCAPAECRRKCGRH